MLSSVKRKHLAALLVWTALWGLFFFTLLVGSQRFPTSDFTEQFHTFATFQAREMAQGRLPLWTPHSFGGSPFVADPQAAVFYLPRWLTILTSLPWELPLQALQLEALVHIWLAGCFTYALAFSMTHNSLASLLAGVAYGLGGYLTSYPVLQLAILETVTWLPLILLLIREGVGRARERVPVAWLAAAGAVLALSFTAGHPQTAMHVAYMAAAYYLFLTIRARWRWTSILLLGLTTAVTAILASAPFWLPAARFFAVSTRAGAGYDFVSRGQPMLHYVQILAPATMTVWSPEYIGLAGVILALFAWLGRRVDAAQKAEILFWAVVLLLSIWIAMGDSGVIYQLLYYTAPGFSLFRQQERLLAIASLSGALLAAQGLALWLRMAGEQRKEYVRRTALSFLVLFVLVAIVLVTAQPKTTDDWQVIVLRQMLVAILVFALLAFGRRPRAQALLLILLLAGDLYAATFSGIARQDTSSSAYWLEPDWLAGFMQELQQTGPSRIDSGNIFWANAGEVYGWEDLSGISPFKPKVLEDMQQLPNERFLQLLNVSHVIRQSPTDSDSFTLLSTFDEGLKPGQTVNGLIYRFDGALPRSWMVYQWELAPDAESALAGLAEADFDPATQAILLAGMAGVPTVDPKDDRSLAQVSVTTPRPGRLEFEVATDSPGFLVISEWANPGWVASLDGYRAPLYPADYGLQGVWVPAGVHHVSLRFQPPEVTVGLIVSLLTLAGAALLAWRWRPAVALRHDDDRRLIPRPALPARKAAWVRLRFSKRFYFWAAILLTFLSFALRVYRLDYQELRGDEAFSYLFAKQPASEIIPDLISEGDPHSPFHYLILHGWMSLSGDSEFAMRAIALFAGVLAVPLMYQLGREAEGASLGLLLSLMVTISPSLVWIDQEVRNQYALAIIFSLLATLLLVRFLRRPSWPLVLLYALSCVLTIYAHYYGLFALAAHAAYVFLSAKERKLKLSWLASMAIAALLFLPWFVAVAPTLLAAGQLSDQSTPETSRYLAVVGSEMVGGPVWDVRAIRWLFVGLLAFGLIGGVHLWRRNRPLAALLLIWLGGAALGIYLVRFHRATFNSFYIVVAAPAFWALVGTGLMSWWRSSKARRWSVALAVVALVAVVASIGLSRYYFQPAYSRTLGYRQIAEHLATDAVPGDLFLANFPDPNFDYYLRHLTLPRTMQPTTVNAGEQETNADMAQLAAEYDRMWFVPAHRSNWDPEDVAFRWLDYHTLLEEETRTGRLTLSAYRPLTTAVEIMAPVSITVTDAIRLEGAYLTIDGRPQALLQSEPIDITGNSELIVNLIWRAEENIPRDYTVFVHLLGTDGQLIAQHDGVPATGTRATTSWLADELILDKHLIQLPAELSPGQAMLVAGMYDSETKERQIMADGRDTILLATFDLLPDEQVE